MLQFNATALVHGGCYNFYGGLMTYIPSPEKGRVTNFAPLSEVFPEGSEQEIPLDPNKQQITRSTILTDEGSFVDQFVGSALSGEWTQVVGSGASISVGSGLCTIAAGIVANAETYMAIPVDYSPLRTLLRVSISQRIANQTIYFGFSNSINPALDTSWVRWKFNGTNASLAILESGVAGKTEVQSVAITPTSIAGYFEIDIDFHQAAFFAGTAPEDATLAGKLSNNIPTPYQGLYLRVRVVNGSSAPSSNTNIVISNIRILNVNKLEMTNSFQASPIPTRQLDYQDLPYTSTLIGGNHRCHDVFTTNLISPKISRVTNNYHGSPINEILLTKESVETSSIIILGGEFEFDADDIQWQFGFYFDGRYYVLKEGVSNKNRTSTFDCNTNPISADMKMNPMARITTDPSVASIRDGDLFFYASSGNAFVNITYKGFA